MRRKPSAILCCQEMIDAAAFSIVGYNKLQYPPDRGLKSFSVGPLKICISRPDSVFITTTIGEKYHFKLYDPAELTSKSGHTEQKFSKLDFCNLCCTSREER